MELALRGTSLWVDHITVDGALVTEVDYGRYTVVELRSGDGQHVRVTLDKEFGRKLRRALRLLELSDQVEREENEPGAPMAGEVLIA